MTPLEMIRHNFLGSTLSDALCDDTACRTKLGSKILHQEFHGYGEKGRDMTKEEDAKLRGAATQHLKEHPSHNVRILIGHKESIIEEDTGTSKVVYEYLAPGRAKR